MSWIPMAPHVRINRLATSGDVALLFADTSLTHASTLCAPLRGATKLVLRGAGFFPSKAVVVRFMHPSGAVKIQRGVYAEEEGKDFVIDRMVQVRCVDFVEEGPALVTVGFPILLTANPKPKLCIQLTSSFSSMAGLGFVRRRGRKLIHVTMRNPPLLCRARPCRGCAQLCLN